MAQRAFAAFQCAALAEVAGMADQQQSLFLLGLTEGRKFIQALQSGKIKDADVKSHVPYMGVILRLGGPSADFMLGRIWEGAVEDATEETSKLSDNQVRKLAAETNTESGIVN